MTSKNENSKNGFDLNFLGEAAPNVNNEAQVFQIHSYHPKLDVDYLKTIYGRDWEYAANMFLTFLEDISPIFEKLMPLIEVADWEAFCQVTQRLKSSLQLVGLSELKEKMLAVGVIAETAPEQTKLRGLTIEILLDLEGYLPILKEQLEFLKSKMVEL